MTTPGPHDHAGQARPFSPSPGPASRPHTRLPAGATDCHFHLFGPHAHYPLSDARVYDPEEALLDDYLRMAATVGLSRRVFVQASPYGLDNRCMLDAIPLLGAADTRGVAVVPADISDAELERMHAAGVRGIRFNTLQGGTGLEHLDRLARRIAPFGWHIQLWATGERIAEMTPHILKLPVDVVIDHFGLASPAKGTDHPDFLALLQLLGSGKAWIKLCGYRASLAGPPYTDMDPIAHRIIAVAPDRCVWGTDWPHPVLDGRPMPDDGVLVDALARWAGDAATLERILVTNPARLYGFPAP